MNGASSFDLNLRGFHWPVTAPKLHFKPVEIFSKNKIPWNFKIWFSKIVNPRVSSDEISEKFDRVIAEMQFSILTGSRSFKITLFYTKHRKDNQVGWLVQKLSVHTFLFMNWQNTVQPKRLIYFSLDFWIVPYSSKGSEIGSSICIGFCNR